MKDDVPYCLLLGASTNRYTLQDNVPTSQLHQIAQAATRMIVTIDGPAGSGKSTAAQFLAKSLGLQYLDTGATYRTLAYASMKERINIADVGRLIELARHLSIHLSQTREGELRVDLDGHDVTKAIRTEEVSEAAAHVAQYPGVRAALVKRQRELAQERGCVAEGRDTGSVVFPNADVKFFLTAPPGVRAKRRQQELRQMYGATTPLALIKEQMHFRDGLDQTRPVGALVKPEGAVTINTAHRSAHQVVQVMRWHVQQQLRR